MARITLRQLLDHAAEEGYGVPAFNVNNMEQVLAVMAAASAVDAPVILQASRGARSYAGDVMIRQLVVAAEEMHPGIPICLHQDHGNDEATCFSAVRNGFTSVMMDGSLLADGRTPATYEENVDITRRVTRVAHLLGVGRGRARRAGQPQDGHRRPGGRPRRRGRLRPRPATDRPGPGRRLRRAHRRRRAGHRHEQFGAAGQASRITPIPLTDMARRYETGVLTR